jgi:hypothetical protein
VLVNKTAKIINAELKTVGAAYLALFLGMFAGMFVSLRRREDDYSSLSFVL